MYCSECGEKNRVGNRFCERCGGSILQEVEEGTQSISKVENSNSTKSIKIKRNNLIVGIIIALLIVGGVYLKKDKLSNETVEETVDSLIQIIANKDVEAFLEIIYMDIDEQREYDKLLVEYGEEVVRSLLEANLSVINSELMFSYGNEWNENYQIIQKYNEVDTKNFTTLTYDLNLNGLTSNSFISLIKINDKYYVDDMLVGHYWEFYYDGLLLNY